jgi:CRISPR/Cas system-associated endonuclease Cas1
MKDMKLILQAEFGTLDRLAGELRIKNSAVYNWVARKQIPIKHLKRISDLSQGRLTKAMMRPDLFNN